MKRITVKAREHHGSKSLDLTIPVEIIENYKIKAGDVFEIEIQEKKGELVAIIYKRMKVMD
jgi:bifunctional DNA-binding transcriptional regulator/antitoxin component of YhaV-PrlF toxin-antitoxin module